MRRHINYPAIPILAIGFSRGVDVIGFIIALVRGGWKAALDLDFPTHAFLITDDHKQKFTTEETIFGLQEDSLEQYTKKSNKIIAMYYWEGWNECDGNKKDFLVEPDKISENTLKMIDESMVNFSKGIVGDPVNLGEIKEYLNPLDEYDTDISKKEAAQRFLARIRRLHRDNSKYDFIGLLSFLPIIGKYFKPSKEREWCSENVATVHKKFGASFIEDIKIAPDQLLDIVKASPECIEIKNYYKEK